MYIAQRRQHTMGQFFFFFFFFVCFVEGENTQKKLLWSIFKVPFLVQQLSLSLSLSRIISFLSSSFFLSVFSSRPVEFFPLGGGGVGNDDEKGPPEVCVLCVVSRRRRRRASTTTRAVETKKLDTTLFSVWSLSRKERDRRTLIPPQGTTTDQNHHHHHQKKKRTTTTKNEIYPKPREREHSRYFLFRFLSRARGGDDRNDRGFDGKHYLVGWF